MFKSLTLMALLSTALSGCLENDGQRALAGAAGGAVIAGATGVDPLTGALIGGAGGALCNQAGINACRNK